MIAQRGREGKRAKALKLGKLYKEGKCRECSVVVTRMDFAKILGKFTKVKIQYESSTPKTQKTKQPVASKTNGRLKNNENGMVQEPRSRRNETPSKSVHRPKILKSKEANPPKQKNNILKENNVLKKAVTSKSAVTQMDKKSINKKYGIIFNSPKNNCSKEFKSKLSLKDLLPKVNNSVLPSSEWCIDYYPKLQESKDDKVYDRIAAELEDLMRAEKPQVQREDKVAVTINKEDVDKADEFPSIMDILNDNTNITSTEQKDESAIEFKGNLDPSTTLDVEAMLLGKTDDPMKSVSMEVDNLEDSDKKQSEISNSYDENPGSPSILKESSADEQLIDTKSVSNVGDTLQIVKEDIDSVNEDKKESILDSQNISEEKNLDLPVSKFDNILHLTFQKIVDGKCLKSVKCPKNLKFNIELDQKSVELIGAPKFISTLDDLQVLLQIVNDSELTSPYIQYL